MNKINERSFWINKKDKEEHWVTSVEGGWVTTWGVNDNSWKSSIKDFLENFDFKCEGDPIPPEMINK